MGKRKIKQRTGMPDDFNNNPQHAWENMSNIY